MAKGRGSRSREEKKPKADKKAAPATPTFLRPQSAGAKTPDKETKK